MREDEGGEGGRERSEDRVGGRGKREREEGGKGEEGRRGERTSDMDELPSTQRKSSELVPAHKGFYGSLQLCPYELLLYSRVISPVV